jgi:hypothetical protein
VPLRSSWLAKQASRTARPGVTPCYFVASRSTASPSLCHPLPMFRGHISDYARCFSQIVLCLCL